MSFEGLSTLFPSKLERFRTYFTYKVPLDPFPKTGFLTRTKFKVRIFLSDGRGSSPTNPRRPERGFPGSKGGEEAKDEVIKGSETKEFLEQDYVRPGGPQTGGRDTET